MLCDLLCDLLWSDTRDSTGTILGDDTDFVSFATSIRARISTRRRILTALAILHRPSPPTFITFRFVTRSTVEMQFLRILRDEEREGGRDSETTRSARRSQRSGDPMADRFSFRSAIQYRPAATAFSTLGPISPSHPDERRSKWGSLFPSFASRYHARTGLAASAFARERCAREG